ncbi:MAG: Fe-S cluster assembly scaffold SufA [Pelagibacteraceae bacterium TMED136]|nr:MAG: Fe-S cluster assembly scaffold SufA [Pelagibacteraceae bacterium TMED136]|tara:strand:+ start:20519 stop:20854 length:336 start_codon:yes stop_codon:yes gene_type:complete
MSEILTFSEKAKFKLKEIMSSTNYKNCMGLRISVKSGGCAGMSYTMDYVEKKIAGDEKIVVGGINVFVDPKATMYLLGTIMDYKEDKFASSFVFNNPNEVERCGCGESFKI